MTTKSSNNASPTRDSSHLRRGLSFPIEMGGLHLMLRLLSDHMLAR